MRPQSPEHYRAEEEEKQRETPEIEGEHIVFLPEPGLVNETFPIPFNDVIHRVELDQIKDLVGDVFRRPEDGREPEGELEQHVDDLSRILQKEGERRCQPGNAHQEHDGSKQVVKDLEVVKRWRIAVDEKHQEDDGNKKEVDDQGGQYLDQGKHPHAEGDLFDEKAVLEDAARSAHEAVTEEEPGDDCT